MSLTINPNKNNQFKDKKKQIVLNKIDINLPSIEDYETLKEARNEEIITSYNDDYSFNISTDMVTLTGGQRYCKKYYLSNPVKNSKYGIAYYEDGTIHNEDSNSDRYSRKFIIRPVLSFDKYPDLFDNLLSANNINYDGKQKYSKLLLGLAPRYVASENMQSELNQAHKKNALLKTSLVYTFDSTYILGNKNDEKDFKPIEYPVYEYDGKKYICFKVCQCYGRQTISDRIFAYKYDSAYLTNNKSYYNGENVWIIVSEIPWIVDIKRKKLIAQEGLLSGIQFENGSEDRTKYIDYENSNIKWYLDNYMKYELLSGDKQLFIKDDEINSNKSNEIKNMITKICQCKKYYYGDMDVESIVSDLINQYNNDLDELLKNEPNQLSINYQSPEFLYQKLIVNLEGLLSELIVHGEKVKNYHDMIDILKECQKDEINANKDELCLMINTIKTIILEFIANEEVKNKLKEELNKIISDNIKKNIHYIEEFKLNNNSKTKSLDELKLEFKKDLHPYLKELNNKVEKQDLVNEIMNNVKTMINNHFTESKNQIVKNYLNILNDIISRIKEIGTEEDKTLLIKNIDLNFDINENIDLILRKLESMIIKAYKIEFNIQERIAKNKEINELKVNIDISAIFENSEKQLTK